MTANGWTFWNYQDAAGEERELVEARSEYLAKLPTGSEQTE